MRVVVLGGTGRLGRSLLVALAAAGHTPVAFGRSAATADLPADAVPFAGDVLDSDALRGALEGADAVICALSIPRKSRSPFAAVVGPTDLHSQSTRLLLPEMERAGVSRLIKVSAQSVGDSAPRAGWGFRALVAMSNLRPAFDDHAVADTLVAASDRTWTIVRPPILADTDTDTGEVRAGPELVTWSWTRAPIGAVARWITDHLDDDDTYWRTLTLAP